MSIASGVIDKLTKRQRQRIPQRHRGTEVSPEKSIGVGVWESEKPLELIFVVWPGENRYTEERRNIR
ncbi:MAG: hypothetical protein AB1611_06615 [bacterium]